MIKEQRKTAMPPVSKMKKGQLMREVLSAEQILHKSALQKQPMPIFDQTYGAEEITRPGAKQFARVSGKKAEGKIIGASILEERLYDAKEAIGGQPINRRSLAKKSLAQTDEPVPATQKVVPATKKQTAKKTVQAEANEPIEAAARDIVGVQHGERTRQQFLGEALAVQREQRGGKWDGFHWIQLLPQSKATIRKN